jgi:glycosyltransferase involved in cell wall biosynthesis
LRKILFITAHRKDRAPNQRFRFEQYFPFLEKNGFECHLAPLLTADDDRYFYSSGNYLKKISIGLRCWIRRYRDTLKRNEYDIIFIAREAFMTGSIFFEKKLKNSKAKIVYDFDDAIWIDVVSQNNKALGWLKDANKTSRIIALADLVFAGNEYLADYARRYNAHVVIVPTTIDTALYRPEYNTAKKTIVIGWSGSVSTIEHFSHAVPALEKIKQKYGEGVSIKVIGDSNYRHETLNIQGLAWTHATELIDLRTIDIGIMPLPDNEWTWGKCGLKGLQYMALEIPTIMSPVGVNQAIIQDGENGYLASTEDDWVAKLSLLIDNAQRRIIIGKAGRKTVLDLYSVDHQKYIYLEHFNRLLSQ